jgi:phosphonate transport system substrate-binding protein
MRTGLRFATFLAPSFRPLYEYITDQCGGDELIDGHDWRDLASGAIDVAFVCSPPVIWLAGAVEALAAPVFNDPRFRGRPLYASDVVVGADSPVRSLADLRGKRWAYNEEASWSGYWVTLAQVRDWSYFGEVVRAGFHHRALRMVAEGLVDASAIDCSVLAHEFKSEPSLARSVRVIDSLGPAPSQPVVVRADLRDQQKNRLRRTLLGLRGSTLDAYNVTRFDPAPDYSVIAAVVGDHVRVREPAAITGFGAAAPGPGHQPPLQPGPAVRT